MLSPRRLTLQLTPLLDLLLIVMFSQYIENRDRSLRAQEEIAQQRSIADAELAERREALEKEFARQQKSIDDLRTVYDERFRSILEQHHQAGTLLAESLNLPGAAMTEILKLRTANSPEDAERLSAATERVKELCRLGARISFGF